MTVSPCFPSFRSDAVRFHANARRSPARRALRGVLMVAALACALPAAAQSVPELGERSAVSSVQATGCTPPSPPQNRIDHCGWGTWALDTQPVAPIAALAAPASYLICREILDTPQPGGVPIRIEVDGTTLTAGAPAAAPGQSPGGCLLVTGRSITVVTAAAPPQPVRGYYIRLGPKPFANSVKWTLQRGGAAAPERALLAQVAQPRAFRVCFGDYQPLAGGPAALREYRLWVDDAYLRGRGSAAAVFPPHACVDVDAARIVAAEPVWSSGPADTGYGWLSF